MTQPETRRPQQELSLPGTMQPFTDAAIFARTNGYLKQRYADIGSRVKAGQLLAEIDTPEIDQQLQQARADLATAEANATLAQTTAERYRDLIKTRLGVAAGPRQRQRRLRGAEGGGRIGARQRQAARAAAGVQDRSTRRSTA